LFTNLFLFHFHTKDSDTDAYACLWSSHDGDRNQLNSQILSLFYLLHILYLLIDITFLYCQIFSRLVKEANKTTNLRACFFYNTSLYWITNLLITITFLYWQVFPEGTFCVNECVCLNTHHVCSIDNWLCELITNNW